MDVDSDVAVVRQVRRAGVEAHTNPDWSSFHRLLGLYRPLDRGGRSGKSEEQCVPLSVHLDTAPRDEGGA